MYQRDFFSRRLVGTLAATVIFLGAAVARAQTGPELLLKPFDNGTVVQGDGEVDIYAGDHTSNGDNIEPTIYETEGRARLLPGQRADPRIGFDANYMDLHTNDPALPPTLVDDSFGFGMGVGDFNGWLAGMTVGVGYAGNGYIPESRGYYGMADLLVGHTLKNGDGLGFVLDYDGHRAFMPDLPLPGFLYSTHLSTINPKIEADIGFPYSSLIWRPAEDFTLTSSLTFPDSFEVKLDKAVADYLGAFVLYDATEDAYNLRSLPPNRRLIFQQQRVQAGVRWTPRPWASLTVATGYGFDQRFDSGFDTRNLDRVAKIGDRPFLDIGLSLQH
jgi:hypothetical protein